MTNFSHIFMEYLKITFEFLLDSFATVIFHINIEITGKYT